MPKPHLLPFSPSHFTNGPSPVPRGPAYLCEALPSAFQVFSPLLDPESPEGGRSGGKCLHPAPARYVHPSVCPLPPPSLSSIPPHSRGRVGRRVRARGVRRSLGRGRGRRPRGDARGCCGCSAGGSSLSGWDGRRAGGPWRAEPGVRASWLLSIPQSLPQPLPSFLGAAPTSASRLRTRPPPSSDSPDLPLPPALGID